MSTTVSGRLGGQYNVTLVGDQKYRVSGRLPGFEGPVTIFTGDYVTATKLLDYCCRHDGVAQTAMRSMVLEGDPTEVIELTERAKIDTESRARRVVACTVEIESDVLEGENTIQILLDRLNAACVIAGVRTMLIQAYYTDPRDRNREMDLGRIARQRDFLLDHVAESDDGFFAFPDGAVFPCKMKGQMPDLSLVHDDVGQRNAQPEDENAHKD